MKGKDCPITSMAVGEVDVGGSTCTSNGVTDVDEQRELFKRPEFKPPFHNPIFLAKLS